MSPSSSSRPTSAAIAATEAAVPAAGGTPRRCGIRRVGERARSARHRGRAPRVGRRSHEPRRRRRGRSRCLCGWRDRGTRYGAGGISADEVGVGFVLAQCDDAIAGNVHDGGVEDRRRVPHRVAHDVLDRVAPLVHVRAHRDAAAARLEADQATHRCGDTDRTAAVACVGRRQDTGSDRSSCAAGRTARSTGEIPRVAGRPVGERLGGGAGAELGGIRSTEGDEACIPVCLDEMGVSVGDGSVNLERLNALVMGTSGFAGPRSSSTSARHGRGRRGASRSM